MSKRWRRMGLILVNLSAVILSLLTFPAYLPWMIAGWIIVHAWRSLRGKAGWAPLVVCVFVLIAKNVYRSWPFCVLVAAMLVVAVWRFVVRKRAAEISTLSVAVSLTGLAAAWGFLTWSWESSAHTSRHSQWQPERSIVCVGDSLTSFGYPERLGELIDAPVINFGQDGITTGDALRKLPEIAAANPQVVVIELGGHDYLHGETREATKRRLQQLIDAFREMGAEVVLVEIPRGFVFDPYSGLERELAGENDLELVSDGTIRQLVLWSPYAPPGMFVSAASRLSDDGLHPNGNGNRYMAERVQEALERIYLAW